MEHDLIRKQTYLTPEINTALKAYAENHQMSEAEVIRMALQVLFKLDEGSPLATFVGLAGKNGEPDGSRRVDEVVYGQNPS